MNTVLSLQRLAAVALNVPGKSVVSIQCQDTISTSRPTCPAQTSTSYAC